MMNRPSSKTGKKGAIANAAMNNVNSSEVTIVVSRHIKPSREKEYNEWFRRLLDTIKKYPGYRGMNVVMPKGIDPDSRIIIYRFADARSADNWENSYERKQLISEVKNYSEQAYGKATGLETWFELPNTHLVIAPPRWKMVAVTFIAASLTSFISHIILGPYIGGWPLALTTMAYTIILVLTLTYLAMPNLTKAFRIWLYPEPK